MEVRLLFVNWVDEVRFFGAGPRSDRSACVEEKRERESILGPETIGQDKEQRIGLALALWITPFPDSMFCFGAFKLKHRSAKTEFSDMTKQSEIFLVRTRASTQVSPPIKTSTMPERLTTTKRR